MFRHLLFTILVMYTCLSSKGQISLAPQHIKLQNGTEFDLKIPKGYHISVAAEGLKRLRFLAKSPDGRLFATDMYNIDDNRRGRIYLFEDWDNKARQFKRIEVFADSLHNPNQILFYTEGNTHYIYIAETDKLSRYRYAPGSKMLHGTGQVLASFPDYGLSYKYGGWHLTRSLAQHGGKIYVSVGSSCNACVEKEQIRAVVIEMNPDGSGQKIYASGLRNTVGIKWADGKLWGTFMGRDLIGPDVPEDMFGTIEAGKFYGWPWYYQHRQKIYSDKAMQDSARTKGMKLPSKPPVAYCGFKAHSAPLGFDWFSNFSDPLLNNHFLVALHGSTSVWRMRGNSVVMVNGKDQYTEVVSGFLTGKKDSDRHGRPCDVLMNDAHSFFVTDDKNGVLYYVWR